MKTGKLIIANWKSQKTLGEVEEWLSRFATLVRPQIATWSRPTQPTTVVIAPPYPFLPLVSTWATEFPFVRLGVQDLSPFPAGSYTGAVSTRNLSAWPIGYALLGHSERRRYFHETTLEVAQKVREAVEVGITPVICLDEPEFQSQAEALEPRLLAQAVLAYEPQAAIGTGRGQAVAELLVKVEQVRAQFGPRPILYGGSVNLEQIAEYLLATDGVLVGGASLDPATFFQLVSTSMNLGIMTP